MTDVWCVTRFCCRCGQSVGEHEVTTNGHKHRVCTSCMDEIFKAGSNYEESSFTWVCPRAGSTHQEIKKPLLQKGSAHYKGGDIEPIEYIAAQGWLPAFCRANVVKYVTRSEHSINPIEDLDKAKHYIEFLQAQIRGEM